jgi:formate C-acetyltransferase
MLKRGCSVLRNKKEAPDFGDPEAMRTFNEFYGMFIRHLEYRIEEIIRNKVKYYRDRFKIAPSPLLSSVMDNCIENGKDLSADGAQYNMYSLFVSELSHCVDSMAAIKKLVYEEKSLNMGELIEALRTNFRGNERLRQRLLKRIPKFGNDDPDIDALAKTILTDIDSARTRVCDRIGRGNLIVGLGVATFETYMSIGYNIGASADGRLERQSVASNLSPSMGMDLGGPTAAIKSTTKPNLIPYYHGCPVDLQINSNEVSGPEGIRRMVGIIKSFLELNGVILTLTTVRRNDMVRAQKEPGKYHNLRVRMGGLSAYFVALSKEHQDVLIGKIKHDI